MNKPGHGSGQDGLFTEGQDHTLARPGQSLRCHLLGVAKRAEDFAASFGAGQWGKVCGLLHDIGKASDTFQKRVRGDLNLRVDHSTAGARHAAEQWSAAGTLLAYCIAGHHSGLPDGTSTDSSCLRSRLDPGSRVIASHEGWRTCLQGHWPFAPPTAPPIVPRPNKVGFQLSLFIRMLFSCLVDADRLDAEAVGHPEGAARRGGYPGLDSLSARLDDHLGGFVADTAVKMIRAEVLAACRQAAARVPGLFSLTVPTGGGKTLSSLSFAFRHALRHGLNRVVYVIPYTSIIEQNARVFRDALGDHAGEFVVEHHSNLSPPEGAMHDDQPHPATDNWDAPVIVTTAVQVFESLYSHKPGRCRKLHNLAKSVIILDEAQMTPLDYLLPCLEALRELAASYGSSVVLCTATQPALNAPDEHGHGLQGGLADVREIMPDPVSLHRSLCRVRVNHAGDVTEAELTRRLSSHPQALCIVNTRRLARRTYEALKAVPHDPEGLFHLSALMTPEHRGDTLRRIRLALAQASPCLVVSTALVEAGVDVDFPVVYREEAGLDNIAQAAGRCNREGRLERGEVFVFRPEGGTPPGHFRQRAQAGRSVLEKHSNDLLHPDAVRDFFLELYWQAGRGHQDRKDILGRLCASAASCHFPFREIGQDFQLIESGTRGLIIPLDDNARSAVQALDSLAPGTVSLALLRAVQRHTVSLHTRDLERLETGGAVRRCGPAGQFLVLANTTLYDPEVGLDIFRDDPGVYAPGDLMA